MKRILYLIYQPYKWLVFLPYFFISTLIFGAIAVILSFIINPKVGSFVGGKIWARLCGALTPIFVSVKGKENVVKGQSYVIIANHLSAYDIFVLYGWLSIDIKWVIKKELRKFPGLGIGSEKVGHIFIDRSNPRAAMESIKKAKQKIINGTSVVLFPEGTRNTSGEVQIFKRGAFKVAFDLELPILPITISGTDKILPPDTLDIFPGKAKVIIHEPIDISQYDFQSSGEELINRTRDAIISGLKTAQ